MYTRLGVALCTAALFLAGCEAGLLVGPDSSIQAETGGALDTATPIPETGAPPAPDNGTPPGSDTGTPPAPDTGTPPAPDTGTPPAPDTGTPPAPDTGTPPAPDTGTPPAPDATIDSSTPTDATIDSSAADSTVDSSTADSTVDSSTADSTVDSSTADATVDSTTPGNLPPVGNPYPEATCAIPSGAGTEDSSNPTTVVGTGTPQSCTSAAFIAAVAKGGVITFDCGPDPATITLDATAKIVNDTGPKIVIDGGGLVTLSGGGQHRILYMNTCDQAQKWTTSHCDNQDHPQLTVQNLTFIEGNSKSETTYEGGGAIWVRGGRFKLVNTRFFENVCADTGPDLGGAAVRAFSQFNGLPVFVVNSTFGGRSDLGGVCSNGGGISSIGVSWTIVNSLFSYNKAIGNGGNPASAGTPGGGSGGAIYNDGNKMTLSLCGTRIEHNEVNAFGSAIFFVSNDKSGDVKIDKSVITNNIGGSWYPTYPQISNHSETKIVVTNSTIQ